MPSATGASGYRSNAQWAIFTPGRVARQAIATSNTLVLENKEQGSMVGNVKSAGDNKWQFTLAGGPPNDPGLTFERTGN